MPNLFPSALLWRKHDSAIAGRKLQVTLMQGERCSNCTKNFQYLHRGCEALTPQAISAAQNYISEMPPPLILAKEGAQARELYQPNGGHNNLKVNKALSDLKLWYNI